MFQNRATQNIPFNEGDISNVIYNNNNLSSFLQPKEILQKSSTGKNYAQKRPGINYKSFGEKFELDNGLDFKEVKKMIIIETCPKCGHDLTDLVITTNPPIPKKECFNCGWSWEGEPEQIIKVPFVANESPYATMDSFQNGACATCGNNPKNGGSGICHCTLGQTQITC